MKKLGTFLTTFLLALAAIAQDKIPAFGEIDRADLEMKTCDFDPDTDVVYLLDVGEAKVLYNNSTSDRILERRIRIKILKETGKEEANIKIPYYSKNATEEIKDLVGYTYNLDNSGEISTTTLDQSIIYNKKIDKETSMVSFAFPNVKVGTVIEYKYITYQRNSYVDIDNWYFQKEKAVKYSAFHLVMSSYFPLTEKYTNWQQMQVIRSKNEDEGIWYIMQNIPGLADEPFHAGIKDYLQRVDFQMRVNQTAGDYKDNIRNSWQNISENLLEADWFGFQITKKIQDLSEFKTTVKSLTNEKDKISFIYKYVQQNMDWNGNYSKGSNDGIKNAWDKKSGTTGDINLLLLNLLKDAGIQAYPCLVSTKNNGKINTAYPFIDQFNSTYVYVKTIDRPYILNAADKYNPMFLIPPAVQNTYGFLVDNKIGGFVTLTDNEQKLKHAIALHITVDEAGNFNGGGQVSSYDYAKSVRTKTYKLGKLKEVLSKNSGIDIKIDSVTIDNLDIDSLPLNQDIAFSGTLKSSGVYSFLPYTLFTNISENPFIAERRQTDIDFGYNQYYGISGGYTIPTNYEFEDLPKNLSMIMPDTSIIVNRMMQQQNNTVNFRITIDYRRPQYSIEEYPMLKEFYRKLYAILNEQIVIKKKP